MSCNLHGGISSIFIPDINDDFFKQYTEIGETDISEAMKKILALKNNEKVAKKEIVPKDRITIHL